MYEWDKYKRAANLAKHGVDFSVVDEIDLSAGMTEKHVVRAEVRFRTVTYFRGRAHVIIWTLREGVIRVISLRKANERETKRYEAFNSSNS